MSEQSKTPRWMKVALAIQAIVICLGLWLFTASIRSVREVQLPAPSEELPAPLEGKAIVKVPNDPPLTERAFADVPKDAPATRSPDVPGQPSVVPALPPNLVSSTPLTLGSDGGVSLGAKNMPSAAQPTPSNSDPADLNPPLSNANQLNPELPNLQNSKAEQSNRDVTNQQLSDTEIPNLNPRAVNETTTRKNLSGSANEIRVFRLQNRTSKEMFLVIREVFDKSAQITVDDRSNSLIVVASPPIMQKVTDFITEMESQADAANAVDRPAISRTGATNSVAQFPSDERDAEFDRQAKQVALQIRTARPNEKAKLKKELEAITRKQFEHRQNRRREEFDSLGQRVERLKSSYQRRQAHQDEVIQRRINELLDPNTDLRWDETETTGESLSNREEAANVNDNAIETAMQGSPFSNQTSSSKSPPSNLEETEPTYNSVTLSQWMRLLETERNLEKIAEAVEAMNHLMDQADPTQLTRTILRIMRFHGSRLDDYTTDVIRNGSVNLLKLLPSEIVVEELIAELAASSSRKPTQDFYAYFLSSVETLEATDRHFLKKNTNFISGKNDYTAVEPSVLSDSTQRLRVEIRRRSRRLIGVLVNAANAEESLAKWAIRCAGSIAHISDQPITTYPGLVPLVEKMFNHPVDVQKGSSWFYSGAAAAILLGESGLRVPDVVNFAAKRIEEEGYILAPKYAANGMRCLVAIAPFSPDAVKLLGETLEAKWAEVLAFDEEAKAFSEVNPFEKTIEGAKKGPPDQATGINLKQQCKRIIEALAEIGKPAVPAIPRLTAIAESPKIVEFTVHNNYAKPETTNLQDLAKSTIKKIEESKPKSNPQPLPVDDEISTPVTLPIPSNRKPGDSISSRDAAVNAIKAATQETSSVNATPSSQSLPSTPDRLDPTYNNVTLSQWLRMLETERNPEKIAEAVMAMHYLKDQADPRQLTKTIFRLMRFQVGSVNDNDGDVIMNGSVQLLKLLPSEIVVEELIAEITASSSLRPTQDFCMYFFNSIGWKGNTGIYGGDAPFKMVDRTILAESTERLRAEIRRRSRRLISTLINVATQDESLANWVMHCANVIVHVSDQRITTYPGLAPLVEKLFDNPVKLPSNDVSFGYSAWPVAEPLLGESGLRVPEILELAAGKIRDDHVQNGTFQFDDAIRCLIAIAPSSSDAVNLLGDTLATYWTSLLSEFPQGSQPQNGSNLKYRCKRMIDALVEIGNPAQSAIPKLAEIADSPSVHEFAIVNSMMSPAPTMNFKEMAKSAIKKIEEAKPKPDPQPLPDDNNVSMLVPSIASPNPGVSPVADRPLHELVTPVSDPKSVETTYDGITYSQWLKLLETERKPEKLIAAIEACSLIPAKGDERRIARLIFLAEGYFESKNWENGRPDDLQAGCDALARLPGDAVVDELLHALRDEKSYSTGRSFQTRFLTRNDTIPHAAQMREKAAEIISELLKRNLSPGNSQETKNSLLAAASSVWRNSGQPMKEFDGLWPQLQQLLSDGYGQTDAITFESQEWMIAATNVVVGAPETPDLANVLLAHAKKHDPHGAPIIALIGKLGPQAESVVPELVELFLVKLKKLELLPRGTRGAGGGGFYPANENAKQTKERNLKVAIANGEQQTRVALVRALGDIGIGQKGFYLLSELKLIATRQAQVAPPEYLDEILNAADEALQKFGSIKYPRDEKRLLSDRWRLNGRWKLVTKLENSETDERPRDISVQIREDQLHWETNFRPKALVDFMNSFVTTGNRINPNLVTVDDTKSPKQIMLSAYILLSSRGNEVKLRKMAGIYELTDDKLKIQLSQLDQPSPKEFWIESGPSPEGQMLLEFERIVPEAAKNVGGLE